MGMARSDIWVNTKGGATNIIDLIAKYMIVCYVKTWPEIGPNTESKLVDPILSGPEYVKSKASKPTWSGNMV